MNTVVPLELLTQLLTHCVCIDLIRARNSAHVRRAADITQFRSPQKINMYFYLQKHIIMTFSLPRV